MKKVFTLALAVLLLLSMVACGSTAAPAATEAPAAAPAAPAETKAPVDVAEEVVDFVAPEAQTPDEYLLGKYGEVGVPFDAITLTDAQKEAIKAGNFTCGISFHYTGNDFSTAQLNGISETCAELGIEVIAVTDANMSSEQQVTDIENLTAMGCDMIICCPTDQSAVGAPFHNAAAQGIELIFMDAVPDGLAQEEITALVSSDGYGNGIAAAQVMAEELNGKGKVGILYWENPNPSVNMRRQAVKDFFDAHCPDIEYVEEGFAETTELDAVADAMLAKYPDLDGVFAVWDVPAESVLAAARNRGMNDLIITTIDLGTNCALVMAQGGQVKGIGAQKPYFCGIAEATVGALALIGEEVPSYVTLTAQKCVQENLVEAWGNVYSGLPPVEILDALSAAGYYNG